MDGIAGVKERGERERERGLDGGVFIDRICVYIFEKIFCVALSIFFLQMPLTLNQKRIGENPLKLFIIRSFCSSFFFVFSSGAHRRRAT